MTPVLEPADHRYFIPGDIMVLLAVSLRKASDAILVAAQTLVGADITDATVQALMQINVNITRMEGILRAVVEETPKEGIKHG